MLIDTPTIVSGVATLLIGGSIVGIVRHTTNDEIHPKKSDIVFKATCEAEMQGQKDCVEVKIDALKEKIISVDSKSDQILNILLKHK